MAAIGVEAYLLGVKYRNMWASVMAAAVALAGGDARDNNNRIIGSNLCGSEMAGTTNRRM